MATRPGVAGGRNVMKYGGKFQHGFAAFLRDGDLADVVVVVEGKEHKAHMLLLSYHSEFFKRAFTADFKEKEERRIVLGFDDPAGVWPVMLEFFYTDEVVLTDDTVLPLLAMARELMVKSIEDYCSDYAQNSLEASNAIQYLNQAVQFNCDSFRESCVALVAEGFPASFHKPTDGLPSEVVLEVLTHPALVVQTEEQVLTFVLNYVQRHDLPPETMRKLYEQVRFPYLSNERLASLVQEEGIPKDLLLPAMAVRFSLIDHPERLAALLALTHSGSNTVLGPSLLAPPSPSPSTHPSAGPSASRAMHRQASSNWSSLTLPLASPTAPTPPPIPALVLGRTASDAAMALAVAGIPVPGSAPVVHPGPTASTAAFPPPRTSGSGNSSHSGQLLSSGTVSLAMPPSLGVPVLPPAVAALAGLGMAGGCNLLPRKTYICSIEYGLPGGSEYACVPLHEVWEDLVPQMQVRVSGDVVEGDAQSILRVHDQDSSWFMVSGDAGGQQAVWIEVELPPNMRVVELTKYTFSHGMNFANHMFPYGISDSAWFQMKALFTQVSEGEDEPWYALRTSDTSASNVQFEYTVCVEGCGGQGAAAGGSAGAGGPRSPPWRKLRISTSEEQSSGSVRLSVRKLRLFGRVEISLTREGPPGAKDVLACWRRRKEAAAARAQATRKSMGFKQEHLQGL